MKKNLQKTLSSCFLALCTLAVFSCNLDYSVNQAENAGSPEFVFTDATFTRIEDRKTILKLHADAIEQYSSDSTMYGTGLSFKAFKNDGAVSVEGTCSLFSGNTDDGEYYFLDDVEIESYTHDMHINADGVFWNNRTNQLVSSAGKPVNITKRGSSEVTITGTRFSASGFSSSYVFSGPVSGTIVTDVEADDE